VTGLVYKDRVSGATQRVELEGIFVQIGLLPNTDWLKGTSSCRRAARSRSTPRGQTSVPGVFAAGDCDDRALQADHHRHGRRRQGIALAPSTT
jgi:alkyl hydroperoxide reductase subunit F